MKNVTLGQVLLLTSFGAHMPLIIIQMVHIPYNTALDPAPKRNLLLSFCFLCSHTVQFVIRNGELNFTELTTQNIPSTWLPELF